MVGLSFAMRQVAQLLLMCDRQDVGVAIGSGDGATDASAPDEQQPPRIFIYDNYPGGIGFSQPLFAMHADLLARTRAMIAGCSCERGCPTCVGPIGDTGPAGQAGGAAHPGSAGAARARGSHRASRLLRRSRRCRRRRAEFDAAQEGAF